MKEEISKNEFDKIKALHRNQIKTHYYTCVIHIFKKDDMVYTQFYSHPSYNLPSVWSNSSNDQFWK